MGAIVDPAAGRGDPLARRDGGRMADQGEEIAMPACLDATTQKPLSALW